MGTLEVLYLAFSAILLLRGVPIGVVYAGNNLFKSEVFPSWTQTGKLMVRSRSNFNEDGARPVLYLQEVFPVRSPGVQNLPPCLAFCLNHLLQCGVNHKGELIFSLVWIAGISGKCHGQVIGTSKPTWSLIIA